MEQDWNIGPIGTSEHLRITFRSSRPGFHSGLFPYCSPGQTHVTENAEKSLPVITTDGLSARLIAVASPHLFIFGDIGSLYAQPREKEKEKQFVSNHARSPEFTL